MMKVAAIQTLPLFGEIEKNVEDAVRRIKKVDADLVVLPELFSTGYQFRTRKEALKLSEPVPDGPTTRRLVDTARRKGIFVVAGLAEKAAGGVFNSSVLVGPKGFLALYRKTHLFWNEKKFFTPGDTPLEVHDIGRARVGMMICFDWIFPEVARGLALKGADIICHPSNLVLPHCPGAMVTRCLENRVFAVTANRVGTEDRVRGERPLSFIGRSQIVAPTGEVLWRARAARPAAGVVEIEPKLARKKRITPKNDIFKDRREDIYGR